VIEVERSNETAVLLFKNNNYHNTWLAERNIIVATNESNFMLFYFGFDSAFLEKERPFLSREGKIVYQS